MAIARLQVRNFTVFRDPTFDVSPAINVFIGDNATGKSHLLNHMYAVEAAIWDPQPAGRQAQRVKFGSLETRAP